MTRWAWVSVNSGSWCWTGRPGVLQFMGLQRVGHDWATDLIWSDGMMLCLYQKNRIWDFPGGPMIKNLPSNVGHSGLTPSWGINIPYAMRQLNPHLNERKLMPGYENPVLPKKKKPRREREQKNIVILLHERWLTWVIRAISPYLFPTIPTTKMLFVSFLCSLHVFTVCSVWKCRVQSYRDETRFLNFRLIVGLSNQRRARAATPTFPPLGYIYGD